MRRVFFGLFVISELLACSTVVASQRMHGGRSRESFEVVEDREYGEALPKYIPGQLIIKYKGSPPDAQRALNALHQIHPLHSSRKVFEPPPRKKTFPRREKRKPKNFKKPNLENIYLITFVEDIDVEALAKELMEDPQVEYVHPNYLLFALETIPNDPNFPKQWALKNTGQTGGIPGADIKASYAWDVQRGEPNIVVCILDTGVDYNHPDLAANIWINPGEDFEPLGVIGAEDFNGIDDDGNGKIDDIRGWDVVNISGAIGAPPPVPGEDAYTADNDPMDFDGHGTNCSGVLADSNNATGVAGIAWNCRIMPVRSCYAAQGYSVAVGLVSQADDAIYYAANNGADVISNSWGCFESSHSSFGALRDAVDYAYAEGCVLVGGAANYFYGDLKFFPAAWDNVIAVAASDHNDERSVWYDWGAPERHSGSNYAPWVDVAAPGSGIYTTDVGGGYDPDYGGTSAATPHTAATAAMILSQEPNLTNEDVMWILRSSADDIEELGRDLLGYGRINVHEALNATAKAILKADITSPEVSSYITNVNALPICGYASGEDFNDYTLAWGVGKEPNSWTLIAESNVPVEDGNLGYWDTNSLDRNYYTLWLSVADSNGETFDYRHTVLLNPDLMSGWPVDVEGCMFHSSVTLADIDDDNDMEILGSPYVRQVSRGDGRIEIFAYHHNASVVSGWPVEYFGYVFEATPAIADVDGGEGLEIAIARENGNCVVLLNANGSSVSGWPQYVTDAGFLGAAVIFELDSNPDNGLEVIAAATNENDSYGKVYAWHADGTLVSGWPQDCYETWGTPAVADIDADGKGEIFLGASNSKMYAWNDDGTTIDGSWPVTVGNEIFSSPAIADIDDDGQYEIIVGSKDCNVYAWDVNGTIVPGWPQSTNGIVWSSPAIGDIDGDGGLDVVIGSEDCNVYAWHGDGTLLSGWPVATGDMVKSSAAIGDIDGDGQVEVVIGSFDRNIHAFNGDGTIVSDWPIITTGTNFCTAAIADVDNDGDVDLAFGSNDFKIYVFDINAPYDANLMPWPMAHRDAQNTGRYPLGRPTIVNTQPTRDGFECVVRQVEVTFSEPVLNLSADDLLLSAGTVISVSGANEGPYVLEVIETEPGPITATLDGDITDLDGVDMALYQWSFIQTTVAPDFDCDGQVDLYDFGVFATHWRESDCSVLNSWCDNADFDLTGQIDSSDLKILATNWLEPLYYGLVAYWSFDEGRGNIAYDHSANNNDGTIYGATWTTGQIDGALDFDGNGDYVEVPDDNSLDITDEITIAMWLYQESQSTAGGCGVTKDNAYKFGPDNTPKYILRMETTGGTWSTQFLRTNSATILDKWTHIAATYDSSTNRSKIYINGKLDIESTTAITGTIETNTSNLWIGRGANPYFDGIIDEVRVYDRALSEAEIQFRYQNP